MLSDHQAHSFALAAGYIADRVFGEPPASVHPLVVTGRALERLETKTYSDNKSAGVLHLGMALGVSLLGASAADRILGPPVGLALAVAGASAARMLSDEAMAVSRLLQSDQIGQARLRVRSLVGRDPSLLDSSELSRAVIESLAENTVDAALSTLFWGEVTGSRGVLAHRVTNTLDAMIGHKNPRYQNFGWASARLDDVLNWAPARLGALAVAAVRPNKALAVLATVRDDSGQHPSPNGGVIEAAYAAALDLTLGGTNTYGGRREERGQLGHGPAPRPDDIDRAIRLSRDVTSFVALAPALLVLSRLAGERLARRQIR